MGKEKQRNIPVTQKQIIKHRGLFDFNRLLKGIPKWLADHNYDNYQKAHSQKKRGAGGYLEATWIGNREVTEYVLFNMSVDIWVRDLVDVAVEKDGKTIKMNKGSVEITFNATMYKDYKKIFTNNKNEETEFYKFIREIYEKYIIKGKLSKFEEKLIFETQEFMHHVKQYLHK